MRYQDAFDADPRGGGQATGYSRARTTGGFSNGARYAGPRPGSARYNDPRYRTGEQRPPWDYEDSSAPRTGGFPASDFPTQTDGFRAVGDDFRTRTGGFAGHPDGFADHADRFAGQADGFAGHADDYRRPTLDGRHYGVTEADEGPSAIRRFLGLLAGALTGFLAAATAIGVANLAAAFIRPQASPIIAVGGAFIDRTPPALKNFAVEKFGENDKTMLLLGMYVTIALLALGIGMVAWRHLPVGIVGVGLFGLFGAFVAYTRPESRATDVIPSLIGGVVGIVALVMLNSWTRMRQRPGPAMGDVPAVATNRSGWAL